MKKVIIILSAVILFTACKKTDINGTTYNYTRESSELKTTSCPISDTQLVFKSVDTLYSLSPLNKDLQNLSVSFWMKTTQIDAGTSFPNFTFIVDRDVWGPALDWSIGMTNGGYLAAHGGKNEGNILVTKNQYNDNVYHHVVVIYNPSTSKRFIYVDNKLENTDSTLNGFVFKNLTSPIALGQSSVEPNKNKKFIGNLKNVRIYNKPISECEIQYLYSIKP
jgi:hypothetical protein